MWFLGAGPWGYGVGPNAGKLWALRARAFFLIAEEMEVQGQSDLILARRTHLWARHGHVPSCLGSELLGRLYIPHYQSRIFTGRTDAEAEPPILWPPDAKNWLLGKDPNAGKDWRQEEKGMTEDEMVGWHHWLDGHEFEQALGVGDGQGSLECCSPWAHKELDTTEQLNWTDYVGKLNKWLWKI